MLMKDVRRPGWATMEAHCRRTPADRDRGRATGRCWSGGPNARAGRAAAGRARADRAAGRRRAGRPARSPRGSGARCPTVKTWRARYAPRGPSGARVTGPSGPAADPRGSEVRARLIALACTRPPATAEGVRRECWTHRELAEQVGMSESQAHVILRAAELRPHLTEQWVMSELGPEFDAQAAEVCGLYLDPPAERDRRGDQREDIDRRAAARPPGRLPAPGRAARRESEYLRNGTINVFAALRVHSGEVAGMTAPTRNRWDFLAFLDQLEAEVPAGQRVIAILDNLSTHKTAEVQRLAGRAPALAAGLHAQARQLAQPGRDLLLDPHAQAAAPRPVQRPRRPRHPDARLRRAPQPHGPALRLDVHRQGAGRMRHRTNRMNH